MHFRNVHALVKSNRPLSDIKWLYELDKAKGLEIGDTYANRKAAAMLLEHISQTESDEISRLVNDAHFYSLTMDGSTDEGCIEQGTLSGFVIMENWKQNSSQ